MSIGPPRIALAEGSNIFVASLAGEVHPEEDQGLFVRDTRLLSRYRLRIGRQPWRLVSSAALTHYSARFFYLNPTVRTPAGRIPRDTLALRVERTIWGGVHEDLEITNYGSQPASFTFSIHVDCDFADLFEVRRVRRTPRRPVQAEIGDRDGAPEIRWRYQRNGFRRGLIARVTRTEPPPRLTARRVTFDLTLQPGQAWRTCLLLIPVVGDELLAVPTACHQSLLAELEDRRRQWYALMAGCHAANDTVRDAYRQAVEDLTVLRLTAADSPVGDVVVAAGLPWFATLFGRDSLIVSLQTLPYTKQFAPAVLRALASLQADAVDDWRDAQPGKILHEVRYGELAHFQEIPHTPYYGSADATSLYLIALHETYRWTGDLDLVRELLPAAERALLWIDRYGDLDGDGFQEYHRRSRRGLKHQGWKDSGFAIVHADGRDVQPPVALVELQGYVYDAKRRMAELYRALGRAEQAQRLLDEAVRLQERFAATFWWPEEGTYYFALDRRKQPVRSVVSNAGHALWSGIAPAGQAAGVVRRLMAPDMFSGWGIRTLSSAHPAFRPFAYQLGAVWPHDNSLIALGFKRYGYVAEALQVAEAIFDAASWFSAHQLPELFAGLQRGDHSFPVRSPEANAPQGWAAGSVMALLTMITGMRADAAGRRLFVHPTLPPWLPDLTLTRLSVGGAVFDLRFTLEGGRTRWDVTVRQGALDVVEAPWTPDQV